jgi:hypothetical protein
MEFMTPRDDLREKAKKDGVGQYGEGYDEKEEKEQLMKEFKNVLLNFQKNYSNIHNFEDPLEEEELVFNDKIYFMVPPSILLEPSYVITFELMLLDKKNASASD